MKSTALFATDPVLKANGAAAAYWKTGHAYIKRRIAELGALGAFEKSGHYFFGPPLGRGYDDALLAAALICRMLGRAAPRTIDELHQGLPETWNSPTLTARCADEVKYGVVEALARDMQRVAAAGGTLAGQPIRELITLNGIRIVLKDGTWGVVRASSNKPELVIVAESLTSPDMLSAMLKAISVELSRHAEVGQYDD